MLCYHLTIMSEKSPDSLPLPGESNTPMHINPAYPDFVVREALGQPINRDIPRIERYRKILENLRDNYGIYSPGFEAVIDEQDDNNETYEIITQKITGHRFYGKENLQYLSRDMVVETLDTMIRFMEDIIANGGDFDDDFRLDQCMYGTTPTDPTPRVYYVDMDPVFLTGFDAAKPTAAASAQIGEVVEKLTENVTEIEAAFNESFTGFRERITALSKPSWFRRFWPAREPEPYPCRDPSSY